jgi:hypothetical protein
MKDLSPTQIRVLKEIRDMGRVSPHHRTSTLHVLRRNDLISYGSLSFSFSTITDAGREYLEELEAGK